MKIKLHKNLDKKIWDKNEQINPTVSNMLLSIAWAYIDYVRNEYDMPIYKSDIIDIIVVGSITQLFYDNKSDIDMCIVLNMDKIQQKHPNINIPRMLKLYYYDWAMIHICKIYGRKIDLNIHDEKTPECEDRHIRGPNYSLLKNKWLFKHVVVTRQELKTMTKQADNIYKQILSDYKKVKKNGFQPNEIKQFYDNLIASKRYSLDNDNKRIINPVYMAVRYFKHKGYVSKLRKIAIKKETDKYVLK